MKKKVFIPNMLTLVTAFTLNVFLFSTLYKIKLLSKPYYFIPKTVWKCDVSYKNETEQNLLLFQVSVKNKYKLQLIQILCVQMVLVWKRK